MIACQNRKHRRVVVHRRCNFSTFNGRHWTPSAWSLLSCLDCGRSWRSKGKYVDDLPDWSGS